MVCFLYQDAKKHKQPQREWVGKRNDDTPDDEDCGDYDWGVS